jgi:hypothetical protein
MHFTGMCRQDIVGYGLGIDGWLGMEMGGGSVTDIL